MRISDWSSDVCSSDLHGKVTAIDKAAGLITLDHGAIPEAKWPAMTMAFKAAPTITDAVAVGDKVDFDLTLVGSAGEVTAIQKRSEERRVGKECVSKCRSRWAPSH